MARIIFATKVLPRTNLAKYAPDFSKEYKKQETIDAKTKEWMDFGWRYDAFATVLDQIVVPTGDPTEDSSIPTQGEIGRTNLREFVDAITSGEHQLICEHFTMTGAILQFACIDAGLTEQSARLYTLRQKYTASMNSTMDGIGPVCNPVKALRMDDLAHGVACLRFGLDPKTTRLTLLGKLAHLLGI